MSEGGEVGNLANNLQNNMVFIVDEKVLEVRANPPKYLPRPAGENNYRKAQYIRNIPEEQRKPHQKELLRLYDEDEASYRLNEVLENPPTYLPQPAGRTNYDKAQYIRNIPEEQRKPHQTEWLRLYDEDEASYHLNKVLENPPTYLPQPAGRTNDKAQYIRNIPEEQRKTHQKEWLRLYDESRSNYYIERYNEYETQYDASLLSPIDSTQIRQQNIAHLIRLKQEYGFENTAEREFLARYNHERNRREKACKQEDPWKESENPEPRLFEGEFVPIKQNHKNWSVILRRGFARQKFIRDDFRAKYYGCIIEKSSEEQKEIMEKWLKEYDAKEDEDINEEGQTE